MDQKKMGSFMKELRNEKKITQEELSEILGVSNKTVSRWETGNNMPDIVLLMEISDFYEVDIRELLNGERENKNMDENLKETILKVAEYDVEENLNTIKKLNKSSILGILSLAIYIILSNSTSLKTSVNDFIEGIMLGLSFGALIVGFICTTKYGIKSRAFKQRILEKLK